MSNIYGTTTVCLAGTEWSNASNIVLRYSSSDEETGLRFNITFKFRTSVREGRDSEFLESFPTWKNKFSEDSRMGQEKFFLKKIPGGNTGYNTPVSINSYSAVTDKDSEECLPLSPDLNKIMADSNDSKLRNYVWQVIKWLICYSFNQF